MSLDLNINTNTASGSLLKRRRFFDGTARVIISLGGTGVILSIIAILLFIFLEVYPLTKRANARLERKLDIHTFLGFSPETSSGEVPAVLAAGINEYRNIGYFIEGNGKVRFVSLIDDKTIKLHTLEKTWGKEITSAFSLYENRYTLGTKDGYVLPVEIKFVMSFSEEGKRLIEPSVVEGDMFSTGDSPVRHAVYQSLGEKESAVAAITGDGRLAFISQVTEETLFGEVEKQESRSDLTVYLKGAIPVTLALDQFIENLYVGTEDGRLFHFDVRDKAEPGLIDVLNATGVSDTGITAMGFLTGGRSLIVGDERGNISVWFQVEDKTSSIGRRLKKVHIMASHDAQVTALSPIKRNRSFLSADVKGKIILHHATSEQKLIELEGEGKPVRALAFSPKADGAFAVDENGSVFNWRIDSPHPEITLKTLFGKVWYEGYGEPRHVWQSTGGTDDFEPKFSLTPLIYGTIKGTFYALLFAIPLAILGALCVSQFFHPSIRDMIKPVIEIMAALPSVVLGFLAGLWIAPVIEKIIPAVFMMPFVLTALSLISVYLWRLLPAALRKRFKEGSELLLLIPVFILGIKICLYLNQPAESILFAGDFKAWLYDTLGLKYDQRNALVVGFAMGFAVIPIIFTISEDAISNVPRHLISGSLALGATRWQTAIKVVLPTAAAGIFSAVMIGLGRAVGETMIVLMATGNTPVMDMSIFNGFRALSANIAVEIPEAPHGDTLYRVLFLAALLLFVLTFIVNTTSELVRMRLRRKYGRL